MADTLTLFRRAISVIEYFLQMIASLFTSPPTDRAQIAGCLTAALPEPRLHFSQTRT